MGGVVLSAGAGFDRHVFGVVWGAAAEGAVGPFGVVSVLELEQLLLQLAEGLVGWLRSEPYPLGLS